MVGKITEWQPVHEDDTPSPSEAVLEFARVLNERLQLTDSMMEEIGREVIADLALDPPRSVTVREAEGRNRRGQKTVFEFEDDYRTAVAETSAGLIPVAVRLLDVPSNDMIPDPYYSNEVAKECHELLGIIVTTVFNDPELDGKWGWARIPYETQEKVLVAVNQCAGTGVWVYMSQRWVQPEEVESPALSDDIES